MMQCVSLLLGSYIALAICAAILEFIAPDLTIRVRRHHDLAQRTLHTSGSIGVQTANICRQFSPHQLRSGQRMRLRLSCQL